MTYPGKYFSPDSFEILAAGEDSSWWFRNRNVIILWAMKRFVPKLRNYLEIGCGTGYVLREICNAYPDSKILGTEYFEEGLSFARARLPRVELQQLDATTMTYSKCFDTVGMFDVLEHIDQDELVLSKIFNALTAGGMLVLTVPQHMWLWSPSDEFAHHVRRYERKSLLEKVNDAGFHLVYETSFVSLLLPLMALSRLKPQPKDFDPTSEFKISRSLSVFLDFVMKFETLLLKKGLRFRSGGSILLIARK